MSKSFFSLVALRAGAVAGRLFGGAKGGGMRVVFFAALAVGVLAGEAGAQITVRKTVNGSSSSTTFTADSLRVLGQNTTTTGNPVYWTCPNNTSCVVCQPADDCVITGTTTTQRLLINPRVTVTFENLTIIGSNRPAATICNSNNNTFSTGDYCSNATTQIADANTTTIKLVGKNDLKGGIGGAGLRVPRFANVTINGPGTLNATGGIRWIFSSADAGAGIGGGNIRNPDATGQHNNNTTDSCGTVTINGGVINAYGSGAGSDAWADNTGVSQSNADRAQCSFAAGIGGSGNRGAACTLTINGGVVTAVGGKSANGIGPGLRYTANNSNSATATCSDNLRTANMSTTGLAAHIATSTSVTINGGSVYANIYGGSNGTNLNALNTSATRTASSGTTQVYLAPLTSTGGGVSSTSGYTIGGNNKGEAGEKTVIGCTFPTNVTTISCQSVTSSTTYGAPGNTVYGLKDVKTDIDGKVYFWLPIPTGGAVHPSTINLNIDGGTKTYTRNPPNSGYIYTGIPPSMTPYSASSNAIVGEADANGNWLPVFEGGPTATSLGPYKTGFQMYFDQHVAAVGHTITLYKGNYVRNDAGGEGDGNAANGRVHLVRWCKKDPTPNSSSYPNTQEETTCILVATSEGNPSAAFLSNNIGANNSKPYATLTYTPTAAEYGKFIWAEILVRDSVTGTNGIPASNANPDWTAAKNAGNVVSYPAIKVGVVVTAEASLNGTISHNYESYKYTILRQGGATIRDNGLVTDVTSEIVAAAGIEGGALMDLGFSWRAYLASNKTQENPAAIGQWTGGNNISPANYKLPAVGTDAPTGDVILDVSIGDGSTPQLKNIVVCKSKNSDDTPNSNCAATTSNHDGTVVTKDPNWVAEGIPLGNSIQKKGVIRLEFSLGVENLNINSGSGVVQLNSTSGQLLENLTISETSTKCDYEKDENSNNKTDVIICTYGEGYEFEGGGYYTLLVKEFKNQVPNTMLQFETNIRIQQKPTVAFGNYMLTNSVAGDADFILNNTVSRQFTYVAGDGGPANTTTNNGFCYYWETSGYVDVKDEDGNIIGTKKPDEGKLGGGEFTDSKCNNKGTFSSTGTEQNIVYNGQSGTTQLSAFGQFVRLVVRPNGTLDVEDNKIGEPAYGQWKQVGVLLQAGTSDVTNNCYINNLLQTNCQHFYDLTFGGCTPSSPDYAISGCSQAGYLIYTNNSIRLSAITNNFKISNASDAETFYYQINGWNKDEIKDEEGKLIDHCVDGVFDCGRYATFALSSNNISGTIKITPIVEKENPPRISTITLSDNEGNSVSLKNDKANVTDGVSISKKSLAINFDQPVNLTTGSINIYKNNEIQTNLNLNCTKTLGYIQNCSYDFEYDSFGNSYKIIVSGYKNREDNQMDTEQFSFIIGSGPSIASVNFNADNVYAMGKEIKITLGDYSSNGGGGAGEHKYCWEYNEATPAAISSTPNCIEGASSSSFTPKNGELFGKNIRVIVTPIDENNATGTKVASNWEKIGVVLTFGTLTENEAKGIGLEKKHTITLGGKTITDTDKSNLVFGDAVLGWVGAATDKIIAWSVDGTTIGTTANYIYGLLSLQPTNDITINLAIDDGERPAIIYAGKNTAGDGLLITFDKEVKGTDNSKTITILGEGNEKWVYEVKSTLSSSSQEVDIKFSLFDPSYSLQAGTHTVAIDEGAFVDKSGNLTREGDPIARLTSGSFYAVQVAPRSLSGNISYGAEATEFETKVTNRGTEAVTLKITSSKSESDFLFETPTGSLNSNDEATVTITPNITNANSYSETLIISDLYCDTNDRPSCAVYEEVFLNYTINPKVLTINETNSVTFLNGTSNIVTPYTGSEILSDVYSVPDYVEIFGLIDAEVGVQVGNYSDRNVGSNKPITVTYEITGSGAGNYSLDTYNSKKLTGSITPKPLEVKIAAGTLIKDYDGTNNIDPEDIIPLIELTGKFDGDDVEISETPSPIFVLGQSDAGPTSLTDIKGLSLTGDDATNYTYTLGDDVLKLPVQIEPASLKSLLALNKIEYCGENEGENCAAGNKVTAEAIYGDHISLSSRRWPPEGDVDVVKNKITVPGNWVICQGEKDEPEGCEDKIGTYYVPKTLEISPEPVNDEYHAYFNPSQRNRGNYGRDLVVPVHLSVSKRQIDIAANLANAGNLGLGMKTYDGSNAMYGVKAGDADVIPGDDLSSVTANATFADANAGSGKLLTVNWNLAGTDANNKYFAYPTTTRGSIAKRKVNLLGFENIPPKYYNGSSVAEHVQFSSLSPETYEQSIFRQQNEIAAGNKTDEIDEFIGIIPADVGDVALVEPDPALVSFSFINPNAGTDKQITSTNGMSDFVLTGAKALNYEPALLTLKGDILPASLADVLCKLIDEGATCPGTSLEEKNNWLKNNKEQLVSVLKYADPTGFYGDPLSSIQNQISAFMPNSLYALYGAKADNEGRPDLRPVNWAWKDADEGAKRIGPVNGTQTIGEAYFSHGDPNYASYGTDLTIPIPVTANPRQLTATLVPINRGYIPENPENPDDESNLIVTIGVIPGNVAPLPNEEVALTATGIIDNPNAGVDRKIVEILYPGIMWSPEIPYSTRNNYILPDIDVDGQVGPDISALKVSIGRIPWPTDVRPLPTESSILYDRDKNLASIGFSTDGWQWEQPNTFFDDPNNRVTNPANAESINRTYKAIYAQPAEESNYMEAEDYVTINIRKRSENSALESIVQDAVCGSETANITVTARDPYATVWYGDNEYIDPVTSNKGTFRVGGLKYGINSIGYAIQAQAYGPNFRGTYNYNYNRMFPFQKIATWVRDKSLTITLDTSQAEDKEFFAQNKLDFAATKWYKGETLIGTGRSISIAKTMPAGDEFSVILQTTTGDLYTSCKENGTFPDIVPTQPDKTKTVRLIASTFGPRIVAGGTTLTLNTPFGGTITVYTMKGQLVSRTQAVENQTIVKVPSAKGMYIVKLEAK